LFSVFVGITIHNILIVNVLKVIILAYAVMEGDLTVGAVVTIISLLGKAYEPIAIFNVEYVDYKLNKITVNKYLEFLNVKDDDALENGKVIKKVDGRIELKNVSFGYEDNQVINDLSLVIESGTSIALVGESGSGKSTIIKLLMGLIKPDDGKVLVKSIDLEKVSLNSYYDHVSYVSQEVPIFDGTLRENLVFDKNVSDDEIIEVLKLVSLEQFYSKLQNGLDTELGERGIKLSGGEKQRVALARLFFEDTKIIILDEATSALDNITEKKVMNSIFEKLSNRTVIMIAHRLDSIKNVEEVLVLKDGEIVERGLYDELLQKDGYFTKLYKAKK